MARRCEPFGRSEGIRSCDRCRKVTHYDEQLWKDGETGLIVCSVCADSMNSVATGEVRDGE